MDLKDFPDWHTVVSKHWKDTTAYLLAFGEPCLTIREDEIAHIRANRVLVGLDESALAAWSPEGSWFLAVLVCPGDDIRAFAEWARGRDVARVHFYVHPRVDAFEALQPWLAAGLSDPRVDEGIDSWQRLHKRFGRDLSVQVLKDWGTGTA